MKVVCIADTHNFHHHVDVPDADILIHAGDFTLAGSLSEVLDFNDWLGTLNHTYKIVIAGNHDKCLGKNDTLGFKMITNGIYLQNSSIDIEGIKIWGSPLTPAFKGMREGLTFYADRDGNAMKRTWQGMPKKVDILVTHGPPLGILDYVEYGPDKGLHVGDGMLADKVIQKKPKYHIFGHIHEAYGTFKADYGTKFINCSVVNASYNVINKPIEFEI